MRKKPFAACLDQPDTRFYWCPFGSTGTGLSNCMPSGAAGNENGVAGYGVCCQ
jgi:hypothetical protein